MELIFHFNLIIFLLSYIYKYWWESEESCLILRGFYETGGHVRSHANLVIIDVDKTKKSSWKSTKSSLLFSSFWRCFEVFKTKRKKVVESFKFPLVFALIYVNAERQENTCDIFLTPRGFPIEADGRQSCQPKTNKQNGRTKKDFPNKPDKCF